MKKFSNLKIVQVKKELSKKQFIEILHLIKKENNHALVSRLNENLIRKYLKIAITSNNIFLYVLKKKKFIIGYALYAKSEDYLIKDFHKIRFKILANLILSFRFLTLINIFLAITKIDKILLNKKKNLKKNCLNLNLLAIKKEYQSSGFGKYFFDKTIKNIHKNIYKFKYITCEAPTVGSVNFYLKKNNFKFVGKKIRITNNLTVLKKRYYN